MTVMRLPKASGGRLERQPSTSALSTYQVGQRTVQLFQQPDGHVHWVCNCDDYSAAAGSAHGAWCKHVAKASAIRSIERLTGARVIARTRVPAGSKSAKSEVEQPGIEPSVRELSQSH
jgi:hypothetical protein